MNGEMRVGAALKRGAKLVSVMVRDMGRQMERAHLMMAASSLAYTTILSIVPLLAVSFAVFHAFGGAERIVGQKLIPFVLQNLAQGSSDEVLRKLHGFVHNAHAKAVGVTGLLGLIFTGMSMLFSIERAINQVWGAQIRRPILRRLPYYAFFVTVGPLALAVAIGVASATQTGLARILPGGTVILALDILILSTAYKFVPNADVHWPHALAAGTFAAVGLDLARRAYGLYTAKVVTYNHIYGSLGAIPILLLWIYIFWVVILLGAAISAVLQRRLEEKTAGSGLKP